MLRSHRGLDLAAKSIPYGSIVLAAEDRPRRSRLPSARQANRGYAPETGVLMHPATKNSWITVGQLYGEWCVLRVPRFVRIRMPSTESHRILTNPATKKHLTLRRAKLNRWPAKAATDWAFE